MILSRRAALGGTQLDSLHSSIVIRNVDPGVPHESVNAVNRMGGFGQRMTSHHWETLEVRVTFAIDVPKRNLALRREVFDKVVKWALGCGWLTTNQMSGKRMYADKAILPSGGDMWDWTGDYTITFRAYGVPFWQDDTATTSTGSSITVPGELETVCDVEVENTGSSTIDSLTVTVGSSTISFTNLGLAEDEVLKIGHGTDGLLWIRIYESSINYRNAMDKRTAGSADDLTVKPGTNAITVSAGTATVRCFGRYA